MSPPQVSNLPNLFDEIMVELEADTLCLPWWTNTHEI